MPPKSLKEVDVKTVEEKYKKYELLEHILALPDTYIGSIESQKINSYVFNTETNKMDTDELTYIPGLLKIFDEVIVNAIDHSMRLKAEEAKGKDNIKHVKNIKVSINKLILSFLILIISTLPPKWE